MRLTRCLHTCEDDRGMSSTLTRSIGTLSRGVLNEEGVRMSGQRIQPAYAPVHNGWVPRWTLSIEAMDYNAASQSVVQWNLFGRKWCGVIKIPASNRPSSWSNFSWSSGWQNIIKRGRVSRVTWYVSGQFIFIYIYYSSEYSDNVIVNTQSLSLWRVTSLFGELLFAQPHVMRYTRHRFLSLRSSQLFIETQ